MTVGDGTVTTQTSFLLTVTAVNDAPVASDQITAAKENTTKSITLTASDLEGDTLTYSVVTGPSSGTLSGAGAQHGLHAQHGFTGQDSFTFVANDGSDDSNVATVTINVAANNAPIANAQSVSLNEDGSLAIMLIGFDPDGDPISYALVSSPASGILTGVVPNLTYTPGATSTAAMAFLSR